MAFAFAGVVAGQDGRPAEERQDMRAQPPNRPRDPRNNAIRQLGLSREQMQQIRRLNADRKPLMVEAQRRFRMANRALDEAIYGDRINEVDVQARLKDVQLAQAEVMKIRFTNEFAVRRILTPDQLFRFRGLRQRFEQNRQRLEDFPRADGVSDSDSPAVRNVKSIQPKPPPIRRAFRQNQLRRDF